MICFPLKLENAAYCSWGRVIEWMVLLTLFKCLHLQFLVFLESCFLTSVRFVLMFHFKLYLNHLSQDYHINIYLPYLNSSRRYSFYWHNSSISSTCCCLSLFSLLFNSLIYMSVISCDVSLFSLKSSVSLFNHTI